MSNNPKYGTQVVALAAALGRVHPDTVRRVLSGEPTRPSTRERALEGLKGAGVSEPDLERLAAAADGCGCVDGAGMQGGGR